MKILVDSPLFLTKNETFRELFIDEKEDLEVSCKKNVDKIIALSFKKIRIRKSKIHKNIEEMLQKKENIKAKMAVIENDEDDEKYEELNKEFEEKI